MAATTAGLKDLSFATVDGGDVTPTATVTTNSSIMGTTIDLFDGTPNNLLPDEIALRLGIRMDAITGTQSGANTPTYQVFAIWMTQTGTGTPTFKDEESDLVAVISDTTTITGLTTAAPHILGPSNPRIFACKGRYLRLLYKINAAANIAGQLTFGADWAGLFSKTEG